MIFDGVASLGGFCQVAHQIERFFGAAYRSTVFDWLVTPFDAISAVIRDRGSNLGKSFKINHLRDSVICDRYDILYHHEVERDDNNVVMMETADPVRSHDKLKHKWNTTEALLSGSERCLLVRLGGRVDLGSAFPYHANPRPLPVSNLNELCSLLSATYPKLQYRLCFVYHPHCEALIEDEPTHPNLDVVALSMPNQLEWYGSDALWDEVFSRYEMSDKSMLIASA